MAQDQSVPMKITTLAVSLGAGWVAQKAVAALWTKVTGHSPVHGDDDDATVASIVAFAAVTSATAALTRVLATRGTSRFAKRLHARKR